MLIRPLASANATGTEEKLDAKTAVDFDKDDGTLHFFWTGDIQPGMARFLRAEFAKYATISHRVVLISDNQSQISATAALVRLIFPDSSLTLSPPIRQ